MCRLRGSAPWHVRCTTLGLVSAPSNAIGARSHAPGPAAEPAWFAPGHNCWRTAAAERATVLVDGDAYFRAVAAAIERAERSVVILSWDVDSRTPMARTGTRAQKRTLGQVLHAALRRRPALEVRVLNWDFAVLYAFEREFLPRLRREWRAHPRLHFRFDGTHPLGACHHQKVVVVDDAVAFAGGLDICDRRWDTPAHDCDDARLDLGGKPYPPFHDVQMVVDGAAARALGDLARARWHEATGEDIAAVPSMRNDPWPRGVTPDFTGVEIAIARTIPAGTERPAVREVETLFRDVIAAARRWIYAENQYLTSSVIGDLLAARLEEPDGPEVVLVLPREGCGWLEEQTMSMRRKRILDRLHASDRHGRLRVYAPMVGEAVVNVHSKVMIVDDVFLRVGSANLSNRSMAVDTECDLALAATDPRSRAGVAAVLHRLLSDHLCVPTPRVAAALAAHGSLIRTIEELRGQRHTLTPLVATTASWLDGLPSEAHFFDPPEPVDPARLFATVLSGLRPDGGRPWLPPWFPWIAGALGCIAGLATGRSPRPRRSPPVRHV